MPAATNVGYASATACELVASTTTLRPTGYVLRSQVAKSAGWGVGPVDEEEVSELRSVSSASRGRGDVGEDARSVVLLLLRDTRCSFEPRGWFLDSRDSWWRKIEPTPPGPVFFIFGCGQF
jgi:hypothetical protein